jgi:anti-sigma regulatory factor (Ser/Thr protein kinase)
MEAILPPEAASLARARAMVGRVVDAPREVVADAQLVMTELLANEIKHGRYPPGDPLMCRARRKASVLRLEVTHRGPGFHMPRAPVPISLRLRETGWGLALITRIADRWGVDDRADRRLVWAEIDVPARAG